MESPRGATFMNENSVSRGRGEGKVRRRSRDGFLLIEGTIGAAAALVGRISEKLFIQPAPGIREGSNAAITRRARSGAFIAIPNTRRELRIEPCPSLTQPRDVIKARREESLGASSASTRLFRVFLFFFFCFFVFEVSTAFR